MDATIYFSDSYQESRRRFRDSAERAGFALLPPQPIEADHGSAEAPLTIDAATIGPDDAEETLVVSSGLHGVEGAFGAAAQLAVFEAIERRLDLGGRRVVLIHALNPFGHEHGVRWNENGVDLNRNFLREGERYEGCAPEYGLLSSLLNPETAPTRPDLFYALAAAPIARHGFIALKNALSTGQYAYPQGLWFGGDGPEQLMRLLESPMRDQDGSPIREPGGAPFETPLLDVWLGASPIVRWYDLHTGLGRWGAHRLFVNPGLGAGPVEALRRRHGAETIVATFDGVEAMPNRGLLRSWIAQRCAGRDVAVMTAEFGTYGPLKVLKALRAEQRARLYGDRSGAHAWAAAALREVFAPASPTWRRQVVDGALTLVRQALWKEEAGT